MCFGCVGRRWGFNRCYIIYIHATRLGPARTLNRQASSPHTQHPLIGAQFEPQTMGATLPSQIGEYVKYGILTLISVYIILRCFTSLLSGPAIRGHRVSWKKDCDPAIRSDRYVFSPRVVVPLRFGFLKLTLKHTTADIYFGVSPRCNILSCRFVRDRS